MKGRIKLCATLQASELSKQEASVNTSQSGMLHLEDWETLSHPVLEGCARVWLLTALL